MQYLALTLYLLLPFTMFAEITIDSVGLNQTINSSTKKAYEHDKKKEQSSGEGVPKHNNCYLIQNSDYKNLCLAGSGKYPNSCYSINNEDIKNTCLGITKYPNSCYSIKNENFKNICLAKTKYPNSCHSIYNDGFKQLCLGITKYPTSCFSTDLNDDLKHLCLGLR